MLRQLTEKDIPALITLETLIQESPWSEDIFKQCLAFGSQGWVIELDHQTIGFAMLFSKVGEGHILNIGIHPTYQRHGYGHALMETLFTAAVIEKLHILYLEVRRSNHPAIALYQKLGFVQVGIRKDYYALTQGREDALVMAKSL